MDITDNQPDPGMLQILANYLSVSMYGIQKQMLARRGYNQWQTDNAFTGLMQNYQQFSAMAKQPAHQAMNPQQLISALSGIAPQQGHEIAVGTTAQWDGAQWVTNT